MPSEDVAGFAEHRLRLEDQVLELVADVEDAQLLDRVDAPDGLAAGLLLTSDDGIGDVREHCLLDVLGVLECAEESRVWQLVVCAARVCDGRIEIRPSVVYLLTI